jgi:hypothetical protein
MTIDSAAGERPRALNASLGRYQLEVVRWNRQINLVSRQDTQTRVAELIGQCRSAWSRLATAILADWSTEDRIWYFDLGSGGGLPGFVWHVQLLDRWPNSCTWLVEPREKRAWFLERLNQITPTHPLTVWRARWGETPPVNETRPPQRVLVSLKALHLNELTILEGVSLALAGLETAFDVQLVIARFYPPDQRLNRRLVEDLGIPAQTVSVGRFSCTPTCHRVLAPAPHARAAVAEAALVISSYRLTS